jgi:hypothetical protein
LGFLPKLLSEPQSLIGLSIVNYGKETEEAPDVGFLEIADDENLLAMGFNALPLSRISDLGTGNSNKLTQVFGYPRDWVTTNHELQSMDFSAMCLGADTIDPANWNTIEYEARSPDPDRDIILRSDRSQKSLIWGPFSAGKGLAEPYGMSGGGCWQFPKSFAKSGVWSAENIHIYGIQSSWPRKSRFLKAVQIIHWLKLISDHYSDLKQELVERYPRLLQLTH